MRIAVRLLLLLVTILGLSVPGHAGAPARMPPGVAAPCPSKPMLRACTTSDPRGAIRASGPSIDGPCHAKAIGTCGTTTTPVAVAAKIAYPTDERAVSGIAPSPDHRPPRA